MVLKMLMDYLLLNLKQKNFYQRSYKDTSGLAHIDKYLQRLHISVGVDCDESCANGRIDAVGRAMDHHRPWFDGVSLWFYFLYFFSV